MKPAVTQDEIVEQVDIKASPERVFEALTDPEQVPMWWGEKGSYRVVSWESNLVVGGTWRCHGRDANDEPFQMEGKFVAIDPPKRLVYTWNPYWPVRSSP